MFGLHKIKIFQIRLICAIAIISLAMVSYEIQLIQFFSIMQWHHFAYMVISIALLGFGASGTILSIFRKWMLKRKKKLLPFLMISCGLLMTMAIRSSRYDFFRFDSYTLFIDHSQFWKLLITYFLFFLPFFSGALAIGLIFVDKISRISTYYFSDLLGAGMGGALTILLFWQFSPQEIPSIIAILPILAGVFIIRKKNSIYLISYGILSLCIIAYHFYKPLDLSPSQFKSISYALNLPDSKIEREKNSPYGFLQVVSSPVQRYAPGLSLAYTGNVPSSPVIFNNGNWYSSIPSWSKKDTSHLLNYTTMSLPYSIGVQKSVLILNAGAGLEISHALINGAEKITAIEPNGTVISLLKHDYSALTDSLFFSSKLKIHELSSRAFLNQSHEKYDLIQLPLLGALGGSIGLNALQEENLLTKESFTEMWNKLNPNGMIAISLWIDSPPKISLKLAATISESFASLKIKDPIKYIAVIRSWGTMTFVIKHSPLNKTDIEHIKTFCTQNNFDIVLLKGISHEKKVQYNYMEDEKKFNNLAGMFSTQRKKIINQYDFNIQPASDDKPYFYQFLRWKKLPDLVLSKGQMSSIFMELGYMVLIITLIQVIILAILFIILPLFSLGWKGGSKKWIMLYFCCLGMGYMFLEIVFIKYFVLYLGYPIYSVAIVISVMLISSGLGSLYSSKLGSNRNTLFKITAIIACLILCYTFFLGLVLSSTVGLHIANKILLICLLIALPSFFMGMPFPIGLKIVDEIKKSNVPWAWGINGCVSVISTSLAVILSVEIGFILVMTLAASFYGIAFLSNFLLPKNI